MSERATPRQRAPPPVPTDRQTPTRRAYRISRDPTVILLILITIGAASALVLGYGPGAGGGSGGEGPLFSIEVFGGDDGPERVPLRVEADRSELEVGQTTAITVRAGDRPVANATVSVEGETYRTGPNGTVVHEFRDGGTARVVAKKTGNESVIYERGRTDVRVRRIVQDLSVSTNRSHATVGDPVAVTVAGPDGEPIAATVRTDGQTVETGEDGRAFLRFERAGNYPIDARRPSTNTTRYRATPVEVGVERRVVDLSVEVNASDPVVGDRVAFRVVRQDTGEPTNASLAVDDAVRWTGADGRAVLEFGHAGTVSVTAAAEPTPATRFEPVTRLLVVERRTVRLSLSVADRRPERGQQVRFTLRRADTGRPVAGEVRIGSRTYPVDENGTVRAAFDRPGERVARGVKPDTTAERFRSAYTRFSVRGPYFMMTNVEAPENATVGTEVTVDVGVYNRGNEPGAASVAVRVGNRTERIREVDLVPDDGRRVTLSLALPDEPGTYRITAAVGDDDEATTTVEVTGPDRIVPADVAGRVAPRPPGRVRLGDA